MRLEGKRALITGGARGQGEAHARRFVAEGARVVIADVLDAEGEALAKELGDAATYEHLDVTSEDDWASALASLDPLHVLVNNAGILGRMTELTDTTVEHYMQIVAVNQLGTFLGMKHAAPLLARSGGGSIVNISSIGGLRGIPYFTAYVASKWAVRGMTKSAAMELGRLGIRVNSVHPGGVATEMTRAVGDSGESKFYQRLPISRIGTPEDIADVVLFLASDDSSYCTGAEFVVDGGSTAGDTAQFDI